jgi:predicted Zn-dependent protease
MVHHAKQGRSASRRVGHGVWRLVGILWLASLPAVSPLDCGWGHRGPLSLCVAAACAQGGAERAAADFEQFFERMFGDASGQQQRALDEVTISWPDEQEFGRQAVERFLAQLRQKKVRVLSRGKDVEYLRSLVETLRPQMQHARRYRTITVLLADSADVDARSFAGGTIVVFRGLLEFAPSEAALVGILGHELAHIDHAHQLRYLKAMQLAQRTFSGGRPPADLRDMLGNTMLWTQIFARPFRPEEETQADLDGATWAYRAGYDPRELAQLFALLEQRAGEKPQPFLSFLRSHPYNRERVQAVSRRYEELQRVEPRAELYIGRQNLAERVPRARRTYEE